MHFGIDFDEELFLARNYALFNLFQCLCWQLLWPFLA